MPPFFTMKMCPLTNTGDGTYGNCFFCSQRTCDLGMSPTPPGFTGLEVIGDGPECGRDDDLLLPGHVPNHRRGVIPREFGTVHLPEFLPRLLVEGDEE